MTSRLLPAPRGWCALCSALACVPAGASGYQALGHVQHLLSPRKKGRMGKSWGRGAISDGSGVVRSEGFAAVAGGVGAGVVGASVTGGTGSQARFCSVTGGLSV